MTSQSPQSGSTPPMQQPSAGKEGNLKDANSNQGRNPSGSSHTSSPPGSQTKEAGLGDQSTNNAGSSPTRDKSI